MQVTAGGKDGGICTDGGPRGLRGHGAGDAPDYIMTRGGIRDDAVATALLVAPLKVLPLLWTLPTRVPAAPIVYCLLPSPGRLRNYNQRNPKLILQRMNKLLAQAGV